MEEEDFEDDVEQLDCDCREEDVDILTGRAHCSICGSSRWLSSEELTRRLKVEAECQADYDRHCEQWEKEQEGDVVSSARVDNSEIPF